MKWNLNIFFKNEIEADNFGKNLEQTAKKFNQKYNKNLEQLSDGDFLSSLKEYESISENIAKIMTYAYLSFAINTTNGAMLAKYEEICTKIEEELLFFMIEFNEISKEQQDSFMEHCGSYQYFLNLVAKQKIHQLSFLEERILLRTSNTGANAFARLFDESISRLKFNFRGEDLSEEDILSKLLDANRDVRRDAALSLSQTLEENQHLLIYIYNMIRADLKTECELRDYELPESSRHESNQIEKASVDALINASEASFDLVSKFYEKKREILGFDKLYDYDRYSPISGDSKFAFEEAKTIILSAFTKFSPLFGSLAKKAFDENWCDVFPAENKQSGAFSHSATSDTHPFILLNFTNRRRDVFTLAHELGHAIHQFLSYKAGFLNSQTPLTTAETASVFCEMLVFEWIKNQASLEEKQGLLAGKIEDIFSTLYRQINFTTFERRIHEFNGEISSETINQIWLEESKKMFGNSLVLNDYYKIWWSYIPHFIHTPFYCYAYGYAQLLVLALFSLYKSGKCENFVDIYTKFLTLGGSKSPKELVEMFDFNINGEEFWQIGIEEIKNLVNEFITI